MTKIIRLTESDVRRLVKRILNEQSNQHNIQGQKLKTLVVRSEGYGASVTLGNGETLISSGNVLITVKNCKPGTYMNGRIPSGCQIVINTQDVENNECTYNPRTGTFSCTTEELQEPMIP